VAAVAGTPKAPAVRRASPRCSWLGNGNRHPAFSLPSAADWET
jgi:hypothetical protein